METKNTKKPDELLAGIGKSIMPRAIAYSTIGHLALMALTSFGLFADWAYTETYEEPVDGGGTITRTVRPYLFKAPTTINAGKKKRAQEEEERQRKAAAEAKAAERAKAAAEEAAKAAEEAKKNPQKAAAATNATVVAAQPAADGQQPAAEGDGKTVKPPEVQPLPPKKGFEYGDDLTLDD